MSKRKKSAKPVASNDFDVRIAVVRQLLAEGVPRGDIRHEITLDTFSAAGRVDLAVLRDAFIMGIEIKSGKDKLDRLGDQCRGMHRCFDFVRVVLDTRLGRDAGGGLWAVGPDWYCHAARGFVSGVRGQWVPRPAPELARPGRWQSRHATTPDMAALLWKQEIAPLTGSKTRTAALAFVQENMSLKELRPHVVACLRARELNRWEMAFWRKFDATPYPAPDKPKTQSIGENET